MTWLLYSLGVIENKHTKTLHTRLGYTKYCDMQELMVFFIAIRYRAELIWSRLQETLGFCEPMVMTYQMKVAT
jgi:hypothetical protein